MFKYCCVCEPNVLHWLIVHITFISMRHFRHFKQLIIAYQFRPHLIPQSTPPPIIFTAVFAVYDRSPPQENVWLYLKKKKLIHSSKNWLKQITRERAMHFIEYSWINYNIYTPICRIYLLYPSIDMFMYKQTNCTQAIIFFNGKSWREKWLSQMLVHTKLSDKSIIPLIRSDQLNRATEMSASFFTLNLCCGTLDCLGAFGASISINSPKHSASRNPTVFFGVL